MAILKLRHPAGLSLDISTQGATWLNCELPLSDGSRRSVIVPRVEPAPGSRELHAYLGATVGRYANRIANARIEWQGREIALAPGPQPRHQLHGGPAGFSFREWAVREAGDEAVRLALVSPAGDQGFPGELQLEVGYRLLDAMTIEMDALATVSEPSPVCITQHAYFNLDGRIGDARRHRLRVAAERWLPTDADLIPLGPLAPVAGSSFDFRTGKTLLQDWAADEAQRLAGGYDHAFLLDEACRGLQAPALELEAADGRLSMQLSTTLPALQLYGGQGLEGLPLPGGQPMPACAGIALEPQFLPDSPHHPQWPQPSCWLLPGQAYRHQIRWRFSG